MIPSNVRGRQERGSNIIHMDIIINPELQKDMPGDRPMKGKMGLLFSIAICSLLCSSLVGIAYGQPAAAGLQCNEFPPGSHFGIVTSSCDGAEDIAEELLSEGANTGVLGGLRQANDSVIGRYTMFRVNEDNMSIDSWGVWRTGTIYQLFDGVVFNDAMELNTSIDGPVFDATFDSTNVRIHNHPGGLMEIHAERGVSIKFTMAGGINATMLSSDETGEGVEAALVESDNISSIIIVRGGSLDQASGRSLMVNLAKGGEVIVRAASDDTSTQDALLSALPADVLAEYWVLARDDGAIYDLTAYREVDLGSSPWSLKMGDWELPLPKELAGNIVAVHTDRLSVTNAGGVKNMLSMGQNASEASSLEEVLQARDDNGSTALYFMEQTNNRVDIYLFVPAAQGDGGAAAGGADTGDGVPLDLGALALPIALVVVVVAALGAALWFRGRSK
jgi:hypothetical protein